MKKGKPFEVRLRRHSRVIIVGPNPNPPKRLPVWLHRLRLWLLVKIVPRDLTTLLILPFDERQRNVNICDGLTNRPLFSVNTEYALRPSVLVRPGPGKVRPVGNEITPPITDAGPMAH